MMLIFKSMNTLITVHLDLYYNNNTKDSHSDQVHFNEPDQWGHPGLYCYDHAFGIIIRCKNTNEYIS